MKETAFHRWYEDWQNAEHAAKFDFRSTLDLKNLVRSYESLNDIRLLNDRIDRSQRLTLLEIGCATAELYRYLRHKYPRVTYYGMDIAVTAIEHARNKYPAAKLFLAQPGMPVEEVLKTTGLHDEADVVYAKDVVHHQIEPLEFVTNLLRCARSALIMRCRTRDSGPTEADPERSCQYHYNGWMPYIVSNLEELLSHIRQHAPESEIVVYRNRMILGGREGRYLPKDCYVPQTGTAETAVGVFLKTNSPGRCMIHDRADQNSSYTLTFQLRLAFRRALKAALKVP